LPQALHEGGYQVTVDLGIVLKAFEEGAAAQKGQAAVSQRLDRGGPWQSVKHCEFADDRSRSKDSEDPLRALGRRYAHLEDALFEPVAAITDCADFEQRLSLLEGYCRRFCQQSRRVLTRQSGQKVMGAEKAGRYDHRELPPRLCNGTLVRQPRVRIGKHGTIPGVRCRRRHSHT
jgi:hypothetical protein